METFSTRQNKVSRLLQKELGMLLQKELVHLVQGKMVTITTVRVSPDLSVARIYISIFPIDKRIEVLNIMNEEKKEIRLELGKKVRHQLRIVPELAFFIDDSIDYAENINKLLK